MTDIFAAFRDYEGTHRKRFSWEVDAPAKMIAETQAERTAALVRLRARFPEVFADAPAVEVKNPILHLEAVAEACRNTPISASAALSDATLATVAGRAPAPRAAVEADFVA